MTKNNKSTPICVRIDNRFLEWIDKGIAIKRFGNRGHAINLALQNIMEKKEIS